MTTVIAIANHKGGVGKTTSALMLAHAAVADGRRVLVIDHDAQGGVALRILGNRNFGLSSIASLGMGVGLYGSIYLLPLYLAQIQGYNALQIGEVIMWMGLPQLFIIPLVPKLMKVISPKCM